MGFQYNRNPIGPNGGFLSPRPFPSHHPQQIGEAFHLKHPGPSPIQDRPCADLKHQLHPGPPGQYGPKGIHSGAHSNF